jgi:putative nucleotidyltransferase with HDIG domain
MPLKITTLDRGARTARRGVFRRRLLEDVSRWIALVVVFGVIVFLVSPSFHLSRYAYVLGKPMSKRVVLDFPLEVEDEEAMMRQMKEAEMRYPRVYSYDSTVEEKAKEHVRSILEIARGIKNNVDIQDSERRTRLGTELNRRLGITFSDATLDEILRRANNEKFTSELEEIIHEVLSLRGVVAHKYRFSAFGKLGLVKIRSLKANPIEQLTDQTVLAYPDDVREFLRARALPGFFPEGGLQTAALELIMSGIRPNLLFDAEETEKLRNAEIAQVAPPMRSFAAGDVLIEKGQIVTPFHARVLSALNARIERYNVLRLLANVLLTLAIVVFCVFYLRKFNREIAFTTANVILLSLPVLFALLIGHFFLTYLPDKDMAGYLFPAGVIGMLGVILLDAQLAAIMVTYGCVLFALAVNLNFKYVIVALLGGYTAVASLYTIRERKEVLMAGLRTALVNFAVILIVNLFETPLDIRMHQAAWGLLNGLMCSFIALPSLPLFEYLFGITTDVRLLELTGIYNPMLQELEEHAPGSYQHSLNVAKLAEPAAMAIGANYLLVRAGAYYHDIGKLVKPKYFSENQATLEDKRLHAKLTPIMSARIIRSHVREGVELAKKYNLPQRIIDFIQQHQGTSLIRYFYQEALKSYEESESIDPVREEEFRYPGPKPQTIEVAIVMLADAVEATATSKLSEARVKESDLRLIIRDAIRERFNDGQFDECNLTLKDLHLISESFLRTLKSRFHFRITYPAPQAVARKESKEDSRLEYKETAS